MNPRNLLVPFAPFVLAGALVADPATSATDPPSATTPAPEGPSATASSATSASDGQGGERADTGDAAKVTLLAYDSFPVKDTALNDALNVFTVETGIKVEIVSAGDTGTMVTKAALTAGNPEGDVMFGVDSSFLGRALDADVFEPYEAAGLDDLRDTISDVMPDHVVTPVDIADVCINLDDGWFADNDVAPPETLEDLTDEAYRDLLVVENPATSSPGMAFVLATIETFGVDGWADYWGALVDNGVVVVDGWTEAYYDHFSATGEGDRPIVVSYATSPAAELVFADPPLDEAPTSVMTSSCFRVIEFAGVLRGTDHPDEAGRLVDFLVSPEFQQELSLTNFVVPANETVDLPTEFDATGALPESPLSMDPAEIAEHRDEWVEQWTDVVDR